MTQSSDEQKEFLDNLDGGGAGPEPDPADLPPAEDPDREKVEAQAKESEEQARSIGWRPKDDWKGDPDKWVDAEAYLKKGEEILPILRKDRERLFGEVSSLKQDIQGLMKYHKEDRQRFQERIQAEHEAELEELKAKQRAAVDDRDVDTYDQLETERKALEAKQVTPPIVKQQPGQVAQEDQQEWDGWLKDNPWYEVAPDGQTPLNEVTKAAQMYAYRVQAENPNYRGWEREFLDKVKDGVKLAYPDKFQNVRRDDVTGVEGGMGGAGGGSAKKVFGDLPSEAQVECRHMQKLGMKESEYVAEYFGHDTVQLGD